MGAVIVIEYIYIYMYRYCNPFGMPASAKCAIRDPGKEVVNDFRKVCTVILFHRGRLRSEPKQEGSIVQEPFHGGSS